MLNATFWTIFKHCDTLYRTCLCHGNLFPLFLVHRVVVRAWILFREKSFFFLCCSPFDECTDCFLPNDMLAASFASHKKQERRRCFCQFSATEENQNSINQAEQQLTFKPSSRKPFSTYCRNVQLKQIFLTEVSHSKCLS